MDIVLGVSVSGAAPAAVQLVLVEGENADGTIVDQDVFPVGDTGGSAADRVVDAILGTRESAREGGYRLASTGVAVDDQAQARLLRDALADRKVRDVTLISGFLAAAALTQTVGGAIGYSRTALLFVEPDAATLAVVGSADGTITDVHRVGLPADDVLAMTELAAMTAGVAALASPPEGMLVVGSGVNVAALKAKLELVSPVPVSAPEEPAMALARGAALASAHAPLFESSTSALAWARDPGTGMIDPELMVLGYGYLGYNCNVTPGEPALAYSAVMDDAPDDDLGPRDDTRRARRPFLLVGSTIGALSVTGLAAFAVAVAVGIQPTGVGHPVPAIGGAVPAQQLPAPAPKIAQPAPPEPPPSVVSAPPPSVAPAPTPPVVSAPSALPEVAPAPIQTPVPAARQVPASVPAAPAPVPEVKAPAPVPVAPAPAPEAPAPVPEAPAPMPAVPAPAPIQLPIRLPIPIPLPILIPAPALVPAAPAPVPAAPVPAAPAPIEPPAIKPAQPQHPAPILPPIFRPPTQTAPKTGGGRDGGWPGFGGDQRGRAPGWPGFGGEHRGGSPGWPGFGGGQRGDAPGFPGGGLLPFR